MRAVLTFAFFLALSSPALAQQAPNSQTVKVGPWSIATTYKADMFDNCTMTRSTPDLGVVFIRNKDGLMLGLDSEDWRLERGKAYKVRLTAGSQSIETMALAESKSVTIALADKPFNTKLRTANVLDVHGEGAVLHVPLDGSAAGLERLDQCLEKNMREGTAVNPFVAPARQP